MIAKHTLTGATQYSDKRIFQSCSALVLRCNDTNIPEDTKIEVTLNDGAGGQKLIPNMNVFDLAEIAVQRFPVGHFANNELYIPICDFGCLNLGEDKHLVVSLSGLDAAKTYELVAYAIGEGRKSDRPIVWSYNTVAVGLNKKTITNLPGAILALPTSKALQEMVIVYKAESGKPPVTERVDLNMLYIEQRLQNGVIAVDSLTLDSSPSFSYIAWLTRGMQDFSYLELWLDETGFQYIIAENLNI